MRKLSLLLLVLIVAVPRPAQALQTDELLALVAMPLAVAAVSEVSGVPQDQLADLVATLNNANVAPAEIVQMLRYVPPALAAQPADSQPTFVTFVRDHVERGITGPQLVTTIEQELPSYGVTPEQITVTAPAVPPLVVVEHDYVPAAVRTRVTYLRTTPVREVRPPVVAVAPAVVERRGHPHGGPPGQLKKRIGVQTGAEVVQGRGKHERELVVAPQPVIVAPRGHGRGPDGFGPPGQMKMKGGKGRGHGKG